MVRTCQTSRPRRMRLGHCLATALVAAACAGLPSVGTAQTSALGPKPPWRPFIDPMGGWVHSRWYLLLIVLALFVSISYKAVRMKDLKHYWREVGKMTLQIVAAMVLLGIASSVIVLKFAPMVAR